MSQVEGISIISEMFGDCPDAADEDLAELEAAAEQSEDEDLYAGLQCDAEHDDEQGTIVVRQQRQQIQELQAALAQRDKHITSLQEALAAKSDEVRQLASQRLVLLTNISSLFKTAQAEIKRHTTQLQATRLELVQLKAQLARTQRQPPVQAKAPKQQQQQQLPLPPKQQQQQQLPLPPKQQQQLALPSRQHQQQLPPPPKEQQQPSAQALHDITGSCVNQRHAAQQAQQKQGRQASPNHPPPQQQHARQTQQQQGSRAGGDAGAGCKRCRSSSPHRSNSSSRPASLPGDNNRHKQQKQHAGADAAAGRIHSSNGSSRPAGGHSNSRQDGYGKPGSTSSAPGRAVDGGSGGYNNGHGSGSGRSRSPGRACDVGRGSSSRAAAGGGYRDARRAASPDRRGDRRRN